MKNVFFKLGLFSFVFAAATGYAAAQGKEVGKNAADILRETIKAVSGLSAVEYEIEVNEDRPLFSYRGVKVRAKTKIIAAGSPLRAVAKLQSDDGATYEMFTLNDKIMQFSAAGKIGTNDLSKGFKPLSAYSDFNNTRQLLLDREFYAKIIEAGRILYGGQENIGGDLCNVIVHVTSNPQANVIATSYYWISTKTNLPRAKQFVTFDKYGSELSARQIITVTKQNPVITPETFARQPTEKDTVVPPAAKSVEPNRVKESVDEGDRELTEWNGKQFPALIANDSLNGKVSVANTIDKPTLVTFWATWCGPCLKEMPFFQKLVDKHQGKFQVLAVNTLELDRPGSIGFVKKHPEYKFTFLFDPFGADEDSLIKKEMSITALPTNILVAAGGKIISAYRGERKEAEWTELVDKLVAK